MRPNTLVPLLACALALGGSAAHAEGPVLEIQEVGLGPAAPHELDWGPDPAFPGYGLDDVIVGDLAMLLGTGGDYTVSILACLAEDAAAPPLALPAPPLGAQFFYLVKAQATPAVCGIASWNEAFVPPASQVGDRDLEIPLDPATCPCP